MNTDLTRAIHRMTEEIHTITAQLQSEGVPRSGRIVGSRARLMASLGDDAARG